MHEPRFEMARAQQTEQGAHGIGIRNDGAGGDLLAALQLHARNLVAVERDARNRRADADLRPAGTRRLRERVRDGTHATGRQRDGTSTLTTHAMKERQHGIVRP
jgi:hypothetical protein